MASRMMAIFEALIGALVGLGLAVVPVDLRLEPLPQRRQFRCLRPPPLTRCHLALRASPIHLAATLLTSPKPGPAKPYSSGHLGAPRGCTPSPICYRLARASEGTVAAGFQPVDGGAPIPEFLGSGDEAARKSARSGGKAFRGWRRGRYQFRRCGPLCHRAVRACPGRAGARRRSRPISTASTRRSTPSTTWRGWSRARSSPPRSRAARSPPSSRSSRSRASPRISSLLAAKNRRLFATPDMIRAFRAMLARQRGETSAAVTSAAKLTESQITALKQALKAALGKKVDARGAGRSHACSAASSSRSAAA